MLIFTRRHTDPPQKQASHHDRMKEERLGIDWAGMDALRWHNPKECNPRKRLGKSDYRKRG